MKYVALYLLAAVPLTVHAVPARHAARTVPLYSQCGGNNYTGQTVCEAGSICQVQNLYYSQCVAVSDATSSEVTSAIPAAVTGSSLVAKCSDSGVSTWGQCGGIGSTTQACACGTTCVEMNLYYYQCLPDSQIPTSATVIDATSTATEVISTTTAPTTAAAVLSTRSSVVISTALTTTTSPASTVVVTPSVVASSVLSAVSSAVSSQIPSTVASSSAAVASSAVSSAASSQAPSTIASAVAATSTSTVDFMLGVNTAGYDFSVATDGSFSGEGVDPPVSQFTHFASQDVNIFRIPFAWQLMTPTLGGSIDATFFARYDATVQAALSSSTNPHVIIDLHNYARWNGGIVGQGGPTNDQFASLWSQLAAKYADNPRIIFGIMNEPHDVDTTEWVASVQAAVNAIRAAGATSQYLLLPGNSWSSASDFSTNAGPLLIKVTDPAGGVSKLLFDVHKYLDSDSSGTNSECVTDNVSVLTTLVDFLKANGNRQAILSETGGGNTASCVQYFTSQMKYIKANTDYIIGVTVWAAGSFDTSYVLSVTPNSDGTDQTLWTEAVEPFLA